MLITPEFERFGLHFHQDITLIADSLDRLMEMVLAPFKGAARRRLKAFIGDLLRDDVSDDELQRLWHATPADIYFHHANELRTMLREAHDRL